ncbi:hypothetical protein ACHAW5_003951 [Stephanodiscus triporus]|uniref:Glycosyl transferase CAP10 domain-containing protein n=1 Tax=Stephanodiscus triporus TaxID=2934178 RepID=A0ABD3PZD9_9STRA
MAVILARLVFTAILLAATLLRLRQAMKDSSDRPFGPTGMYATHSYEAQFDNFTRDVRIALGPINASSRMWPIVRGFPLVPIILRDGEVLVTNHIRDKVAVKAADHARVRDVVETIRTGLDLVQSEHLPLKLESDLPVLLMSGDSSGCMIKNKFDTFDYPRIGWSLPSPAKYGQHWCKTIPIPSYEIWHSFRKKSESRDMQFQKQSKMYPWSRKINKAVWRGGTTCNPIYKESSSFLNDISNIPRGKLVQLSMLHPTLIDAAFTKFNQEYEGREEELRNTTILKKRMPFDDQMKFKAIIDIDGNDWSSRFPMLLCTNSVIIKIEPDFIEYFYDELTPMKHYVPASLDNLTDVVMHVMDKDNEVEMKRIVLAANSWCRRKMNAKQIALDMIQQLRKYDTALDEYFDRHMLSRSTVIAEVINGTDSLEQL